MNDWNPLEERPSFAHIVAAGVDVKAGDRVLLRPRGGADIFDIILENKTATITAIEQDYEGRIYLAVTVDDDPGKDFGIEGKPAHRFFFRPEEVEPLDAEGRSL